MMSRLMKALNNRFYVKFMQLEIGLLGMWVTDYELSTRYGVGVVIAVGVLGLLGYYIYQRGSPEDNNDVEMTSVETKNVQTSLKWSNLQYHKMRKIDKKSIANDLYQAAVICIFAIGYSMLGESPKNDTSKHPKARFG